MLLSPISGGKMDNNKNADNPRKDNQPPPETTPEPPAVEPQL
jgi:hypothetical protein